MSQPCIMLTMEDNLVSSKVIFHSEGILFNNEHLHNTFILFSGRMFYVFNSQTTFATFNKINKLIVKICAIILKLKHIQPIFT